MTPGAYIALATDNMFHYAGDTYHDGNPCPNTSLTEQAVISQLASAGNMVYIDPTSGFAGCYANLAVNGMIEDNLGAYTFPRMRAVIEP